MIRLVHVDPILGDDSRTLDQTDRWDEPLKTLQEAFLATVGEPTEIRVRERNLDPLPIQTMLRGSTRYAPVLVSSYADDRANLGDVNISGANLIDFEGVDFGILDMSDNYGGKVYASQDVTVRDFRAKGMNAGGPTKRITIRDGVIEGEVSPKDTMGLKLGGDPLRPSEDIRLNGVRITGFADAMRVGRFKGMTWRNLTVHDTFDPDEVNPSGGVHPDAIQFYWADPYNNPSEDLDIEGMHLYGIHGQGFFCNMPVVHASLRCALIEPCSSSFVEADFFQGPSKPPEDQFLEWSHVTVAGLVRFAGKTGTLTWPRYTKARIVNCVIDKTICSNKKPDPLEDVSGTRWGATNSFGMGKPIVRQQGSYGLGEKDPGKGKAVVPSLIRSPYRLFGSGKTVRLDEIPLGKLDPGAVQV